MIRHFILCLLVVILFCNCHADVHPSFLYDTTSVAILPAHKIQPLPGASASIDRIEMIKLDELFAKCIADYNSEMSLKDSTGKNTIDLKDYKRQYFVFRSGNQKKVIINCFSRFYDFPEWKTDPVISEGGGKDFFSVTINLFTAECEDFRVNESL